MNEDLLIVDETGLIEYGTTLQTQDNFAVQNDFHGGEIGLAAELQRGRWSLDVLTKLGMGGVRQRLDIGELTHVTVPNEPTHTRDCGPLAHKS